MIAIARLFEGAGRVIVLLLGMIIAATSAMATVVTVNGTGLGAIPDGGPGCGVPGTPLDTSFVVSGVTGGIQDINVSVTFSPAHTWSGDVTATLIAPGGSPSFVLFGRRGTTTATGCGSSTNLAGPYLFVDPSVSSNNFWSAVGDPVPAGTYMTSPEGGAGVSNPPPGTPLNATFAGLTPAQINGTWTLRFVDGGGGDTGSVSATALSISYNAPLIPVPAMNDAGRVLLTLLLLGAGTLMLRRRRSK